MTETAHWLSSSEWDRDSLAFLSLPLDSDGETGTSWGGRALPQSGPREYLLPLFPELTDVQQHSLEPEQSPSPPSVKTEQPIAPQQRSPRSKAKRAATEPAAKSERRPTRSRHSSVRQRSPELIGDRLSSTPPVVHISTSLPSMGTLACVEPPSCASKFGQLARPVSDGAQPSSSLSSIRQSPTDQSSLDAVGPKKRERRTSTPTNPTKRQATTAGAKKLPPSEKPSRAQQHTRPAPIMPSVGHTAHPHEPVRPLVQAREKIEACLQMLGQLPIELSEDLSAAFLRVSSPPPVEEQQQSPVRQLETALSRLALRLIGDERSQQLFDYRLAERPTSASPAVHPADGQSDGIPAYLAQQLPYLARPVVPSWYGSPAPLSANPPLPNFTAIAPAPPKHRQPLILPRNTLLSRPPAPSPHHTTSTAKTTS